MARRDAGMARAVGAALLVVLVGCSGGEEDRTVAPEARNRVVPPVESPLPFLTPSDPDAPRVQP